MNMRDIMRVVEGQHSGYSDEDEAEEFDTRLLGPTGRFIVFHASPVKIERFKPFSHFGTAAAARQRASARGARFLHEVELLVTKSVWVKDSGMGNHTVAGFLEYLEGPLQLPFDAVSEARSGTEAARLLARYGYDALVYHNGQEDKGSVSWVGLNPKKMKVITITAMGDDSNLPS